MRNTTLDVYRCIELINNEYRYGIDDIYKAYYNTNEDLDKVLSITDIKDKVVLSVLASSDQLFKCLEYDVKLVDTFDINYLSKYFYYLKRQYILLFGKMLPQKVTKDELLYCVNNFDFYDVEEREAYTFWAELLPLISINDFYKLFYIYPYNCEFDIDKIKYKLKNFILNYDEINIFENNYSNNKKYDVIILSNIMENLGIKSETHNLLRRITNDSAEIICSNLATNDINEHSIHELAKMNEYFNYDSGIYECDKYGINHQYVYKYIKK